MFSNLLFFLSSFCFIGLHCLTMSLNISLKKKHFLSRLGGTLFEAFLFFFFFFFSWGLRIWFFSGPNCFSVSCDISVENHFSETSRGCKFNPCFFWFSFVFVPGFSWCFSCFFCQDRPPPDRPKFRFFFPSPATVFFFFWESFLEFWWCLKRRGLQKHHRNSRKDSQEREERKKIVARNFGPPTLRSPTLRGPTLRGSTHCVCPPRKTGGWEGREETNLCEIFFV